MGEFGRWMKQSPPAERMLTGIVGALVVALVAWAAAPAPDDGTIVATEPATELDASFAAASEEIPAVVAETTEAAPAEVADSVSDPSKPVKTAAKPGTQGAKRPLEPLRATDVGITASTVKVGFVLMDIGGLRNTGMGVVNTREDIPQVVDALVDWANDSGGIHGRKIVAVKKNVNLISPENQRQKCLEFTERDKVFGVIDSFTYVFPATRACMTVEHRTPYFTAFPGGIAEIRKAAPFQISTTGDHNTQIKNWVFGAKELGFFNPKNGFKKLGILTDNCERSIYDGPQGLKAFLKQAGVPSVSEFVSGCDITDQQASGPPAVLKHRQDGVTHVLLSTFSVAAAAYTNAAQTQNWKPKYFAGDLEGLSWDGSTPDFAPDQWDGVRGVTSTRSGELAAGKGFSQGAKACSKILTDRGLPPIKEYNRDYEAWLHCDHLKLLLSAAKLAPRNLTRATWGAALQRVGDFSSAFFESVRFEKGVTTGGGRKLAVIEWRRSCSCYHQIRGFKASYR